MHEVRSATRTTTQRTTAQRTTAQRTTTKTSWTTRTKAPANRAYAISRGTRRGSTRKCIQFGQIEEGPEIWCETAEHAAEERCRLLGGLFIDPARPGLRQIGVPVSVCWTATSEALAPLQGPHESARHVPRPVWRPAERHAVVGPAQQHAGEPGFQHDPAGQRRRALQPVLPVAGARGHPRRRSRGQPHGLAADRR